MAAPSLSGDAFKELWLKPPARGAADAADAPALLGDGLGGAQEAAAAPVHGRQRRLHAARAPRPKPSCTALVWEKIRRVLVHGWPNACRPMLVSVLMTTSEYRTQVHVHF